MTTIEDVSEDGPAREEPALSSLPTVSTTMGSDGLVDLDGETWVVLAKYNLLLATAFGVLALAGRSAGFGGLAFVVENAALAIGLGGVQTYAWLSA